MTVLVLPDSLALACGLPRELPLRPGTAGECLARVAAQHPDLARLLLDEGGAIRGHYTLFRNDDDLRTVGGVDAVLGEDDVLFVLPPIAGGGGPEVAALRPWSCPPGLWEQLLQHARAEYPREACGLVVEADGRTRVVPAANVSPRPRHEFELDPAVVLRALRSKARLVAVYHSHPDGGPGPSRADRAGAALWPGVAWLVVPVGPE